MTPQNTNSNLTPFRLKVSDDVHRFIKTICAIDPEFKFQYQISDVAVIWAEKNANQFAALANPVDGKYHSFYLSDTLETLDELALHWDCNKSRALYTAIVTYLQHRKKTDFLKL